MWKSRLQSPVTRESNSATYVQWTILTISLLGVFSAHQVAKSATEKCDPSCSFFKADAGGFVTLQSMPQIGAKIELPADLSHLQPDLAKSIRADYEKFNDLEKEMFSQAVSSFQRNFKNLAERNIPLNRIYMMRVEYLEAGSQSPDRYLPIRVAHRLMLQSVAPVALEAKIAQPNSWPESKGRLIAIELEAHDGNEAEHPIYRRVLSSNLGPGMYASTIRVGGIVKTTSYGPTRINPDTKKSEVVGETTYDQAKWCFSRLESELALAESKVYLSDVTLLSIPLRKDVNPAEILRAFQDVKGWSDARPPKIHFTVYEGWNDQKWMMEIGAEAYLPPERRALPVAN